MTDPHAQWRSFDLAWSNIDALISSIQAGELTAAPPVPAALVQEYARCLAEAVAMFVVVMHSREPTIDFGAVFNEAQASHRAFTMTRLLGDEGPDALDAPVPAGRTSGHRYFLG